jgi:hypothetical protein
VKLLQEKIGSTLGHKLRIKIFEEKTPRAQHLGESIDKWKTFCTAKEIVTRLQRQVYRMGQNLCPI